MRSRLRRGDPFPSIAERPRLHLTSWQEILGRSIWQGLSKEIGALTTRLKAHGDEVDKMAIAAHMIDTHAFQKGKSAFQVPLAITCNKRVDWRTSYPGRIVALLPWVASRGRPRLAENDCAGLR